MVYVAIFNEDEQVLKIDKSSEEVAKLADGYGTCGSEGFYTRTTDNDDWQVDKSINFQRCSLAEDADNDNLKLYFEVADESNMDWVFEALNKNRLYIAA